MLPTSSIVTLRRSGAFCATTSRILPKPLMPDAASVLIGPAEMPLTRHALRPEAGREVSHRRFERCLRESHRVVVGNAAHRPQVGQGEESGIRGQMRSSGLGQRGKAVARDVVRDPERLAREAVEKVAGDGFLGRVADRVDEAVEGRPRGRQAGDHRVDLRVVGDVAVEEERRAELGGEFADAVLEALALIAEGEFGAFATTGAGDAVGDRPVREHPGDEKSLAVEKSHVVRAPGEKAPDSGTGFPGIRAS